MPKGKYKRLRCHIDILKKNLEHKKITLRDAEKLNELISTGKTHHIKKGKFRE